MTLLFLLLALIAVWLSAHRNTPVASDGKKIAEETEEERRAEEDARRERFKRWDKAGPTQEVLDEMKHFHAHIDWRSPAQFAADWNRVENIRKQEMAAWLAAQAEERKREFCLFGNRYHNPFRHN